MDKLELIESPFGSLRDVPEHVWRKFVDDWSTGEVMFRLEPTGTLTEEGVPIVNYTEITRTYRRPKIMWPPEEDEE